LSRSGWLIDKLSEKKRQVVQIVFDVIFFIECVLRIVTAPHKTLGFAQRGVPGRVELNLTEIAPGM